MIIITEISKITLGENTVRLIKHLDDKVLECELCGCRAKVVASMDFPPCDGAENKAEPMNLWICKECLQAMLVMME